MNQDEIDELLESIDPIDHDNSRWEDDGGFVSLNDENFDDGDEPLYADEYGGESGGA